MTETNYLFELRSERIIIKSNSNIENCAFSGLRDGCIRLEANGLSAKILRCMFLDCCSTKAHGGGICISGENSAAKISTCVASSCYTVPSQDSLAEGQFIYVRSDGELSDISVENICVFQCAPFMFETTNNCQRAILYFSLGCSLVKEIRGNVFFVSKKN